MYQVNAVQNIGHGLALIDRDANGGVLGSHARILSSTNLSITLTRIDNHQLPNLSICTAAEYTETQRGPIIIIRNQYALLGHGKTIHDAGQLKAFGNQVDERSNSLANGKQRILTPDGYNIALKYLFSWTVSIQLVLLLISKWIMIILIIRIINHN
jgi:hypothetical protein